jgi:CheY-like chemotaxis protein
MILLIEDDAISRTHFAETLRGYGYEVLEAGDAVQALALILQYRPDIDLVISDMVLPGMNGLTLVKNIGLMLPRVPIIMVSAYLSKRSSEAILGRDVGLPRKASHAVSAHCRRAATRSTNSITPLI